MNKTTKHKKVLKDCKLVGGQAPASLEIPALRGYPLLIYFFFVFSATNFYFNEISCSSNSVCYAAGENDDNGFIYGTKNGGKSWQLLYTAAGTSLMAAQAMSDSEVFIAGGVLSPLGINGTVFHSTNGGKTFTTTVVPGYYFTSLSMISSTQGFATSMDEESQCDVLIYA